MNTEELISQLERLVSKIKGDRSIFGVRSEVCEFFRIHASPGNYFLQAIKDFNLKSAYTENGANFVRANVQSYLDSVRAGVHEGLSPQRQAELDVVSDFLEMANHLLKSAKVHPAAPAVLVGATLEEFLRTWIESEGLLLGDRKPGLETYSQILREEDLISKQDAKDIVAWGGVRNHAAHGEWDEVNDKNRIRLMLEGVNLFMRKYSP